jgi:hypothetical protein
LVRFVQQDETLSSRHRLIPLDLGSSDLDLAANL